MRERENHSQREKKAGEKIGAVIMVAGRAGLAHATRLGPNSPFLHVLLAIYTLIYFLFCIITY